MTFSGNYARQRLFYEWFIGAVESYYDIDARTFMSFSDEEFLL